MKRMTKLLIFLSLVLLLVLGLLIANVINGNPISKAAAKGVANKHLTEHYYESDFAIYDVQYNVKDGYYHARVISPTSEDSHFEIAVSGGKVVFDTYDSDVQSGWNTWQRLDKAYQQLSDQIFKAEDFPFTSDIAFGSIEIYEDIEAEGFIKDTYGLKMDELELDGDYDIKDVARKAGKLTFYAQDEEISYEKAAELLLELKGLFDQADIPFYAIDFVLEKPRTEDGKVSEDDQNISTAHLLYEQLTENDLEKVIEENHQALLAYYKEEDAK